MSTAAAWAAGARNKFRQVARESTDPVTVLLAEGLTALAEAIRDLDPLPENPDAMTPPKIGERGAKPLPHFTDTHNRRASRLRRKDRHAR